MNNDNTNEESVFHYLLIRTDEWGGMHFFGIYNSTLLDELFKELKEYLKEEYEQFHKGEDCEMTPTEYVNEVIRELKEHDEYYDEVKHDTYRMVMIPSECYNHFYK